MRREPLVKTDTILDAVETGLIELGYGVARTKARVWTISKGRRAERVSVRICRARRLGGAKTGGSFRRADISSVVIGAIAAPVDTPNLVEVYMVPRTRVVELVEARRAAKKAAGLVSDIPLFLPLDPMPGLAGAGSGLAHEFKPIARVPIDPGPLAPPERVEPADPDAQDTADPDEPVHRAGLAYREFARVMCEVLGETFNRDPDDLAVEVSVKFLYR